MSQTYKPVPPEIPRRPRYTLEKRNSQFVVRRNPTEVYSFVNTAAKAKDMRPPQKQDNVDFFMVILKLAFLILCSLASAALMYYAYPKSSVYILSWAALVPFIIAVRLVKKSWLAALYGWFTGTLVFMGLLYWIYVTCMTAGVGQQLAVAAWVALAALMGLQFGLFAFFVNVFKKFGFISVFFIACAWVSLEFLHQLAAVHLIGFPWFMLGYSLWQAPDMLQIASYTGVYGVSFAIILVNACFALMLSTKNKTHRAAGFFTAAAVICALFTFGKIALNKPEFSETRETLKIVLMQPNIDQYKKWTPEFELEIQDTLLRQAEGLAGKGAELVIWPESALPDTLMNPQYRTLATTLAEITGAAQIFGSELFEKDKQYVSAFMVSDTGEIEGVYHKQILVPFGEYIPFEERLLKMNLDIQVLNELGSYDKGRPGQKPFVFKDIPFFPTICYEAIFPSLHREGAKQGALFFANITNDGWYMNTSAPYQHFAVNALRAVENGRPVVRSANTGISGWIDEHGRVQDTTGLYEETALLFDLPLPRGKNTFYTLFGDVFAILCLVIFASSFITAAVFKYD